MNPRVFIFLLISSLVGMEQIHSQDSHFGFYYSYGAYFNTHPTNKKPLRPSDGSSVGCYYHLDNGIKALGFRASLAWRSNDISYPVEKNIEVVNHLKAAELKLQCVLPSSGKSSFAIGIAPRIVYNSRISKVWYNQNRNATYSEQITVDTGIDLNELNSALSLSYIYRFNSHFHFFLNLDQDMLSVYRTNATYISDQVAEPIAFNARLTSLTGSLVLNFN